jgi:hypothetical protein
MLMANYVDMFWMVRTELPGVPLPLLQLQYAEAVREFFHRSLAWQYNSPDLFDLNAATAFPTITAGTHIPTDTYVVQPVRVKWSDGSDVPFKTRDQLDDILTNWEDDTGSTADYWTITAPGTFRVVPLLAANTTDALRLRLAIAPIATATSVPDALANEFKEQWKNGTLARLLKVPGKDWTNERLAAVYMAQFDTDIRNAKSRAAADFGRPRRTVEYGGLSIGGSNRYRDDGDYGR